MNERGHWNLGRPPFRVRVALAFVDGTGLATTG